VRLAEQYALQIIIISHGLSSVAASEKALFMLSRIVTRLSLIFARDEASFFVNSNAERHARTEHRRRMIK